jgi:lambda repressor-like predicted transcriptional regulator
MPIRGRRLGSDEIVELLLTYQQGDSMATLARRFRVRRQTVSELLHRSGLPVREQRAISGDEVAHATALYLAGQSLATVGDQLGYDAETIRRVCCRFS